MFFLTNRCRVGIEDFKNADGQVFAFHLDVIQLPPVKRGGVGQQTVRAGGNEDVGFSRFKAGFGGNVVTYAGAYDVAIYSFKYFIYNLLRMIRRQIAQ